MRVLPSFTRFNFTRVNLVYATAAGLLSVPGLRLLAGSSVFRCQQPLRCGSAESLSTFPKAAAFSTPFSHSLHFLTTVSSTSPSSSSYSTSSYLYWSFSSDILTMAVMSCSALSTLATGAQPFDPPCVFLDGKTRLCRKSAEAQHFCCFAIICFSRLRFWMTRMASGVRLRVNWISFFPSSLPWSCLAESMELERLTPSDESWGLGTESQEHFPWDSWAAPGFWAGFLLFSWWALRPRFLKFAAAHEVDCFSLSEPPFSPPDLLVISDWGGTPLAFFFPNSSLPGDEIRWWRLMGGKGIVVYVGSDQDIKACKCSKCGWGSPAQSGEGSSVCIIQRRGGGRLEVHLLSAPAGVQLVHTLAQPGRFMVAAAGRRGQETHRTKPWKNWWCHIIIPYNFLKRRTTSTSCYPPDFSQCHCAVTRLNGTHPKSNICLIDTLRAKKCIQRDEV